jgi:outer membrane lipoprotein-sorting protein
MKHRTNAVRVLAPAVLAALFLCAARPARAQKALSDYVQANLKDLSASVDVVSKNDAELEKIGKGYVDAYRLGKQEIWSKEPSRMRFQGKQGVFVIRYVTNGGRKLTEVPTLRIHKVEDISTEPGKADSISDLGIVTTAWAERVESRWLRTENRDGKALQVFEVWYKEDPHARHTLWLDPTTKTIVEHIHHYRVRNKPGFRKRLVYSDLKQVNGVWVPTKVSMYNTDDKLAGVLRYDGIKVNTGLADSLFNF